MLLSLLLLVLLLLVLLLARSWVVVQVRCASLQSAKGVRLLLLF